MFLFFDRIYTGAPNITGHCSANGSYDAWASGAFKVAYNGTHEWNAASAGQYLDLNASRVSNEYKSINEIRVKSIISNGYIKLF